MESVKFSKLLGAATSGQAITQCTFDHWDMMSLDPLDKESVAGKLVAVTRERNGLKVLPVIQNLKIGWVEFRYYNSYDIGFDYKHYQPIFGEVTYSWVSMSKQIV